MKKGTCPRVSPASAYAAFCCCIGIIWTMISYMQMCGGINSISPTPGTKAWTWFIPIYVNIYFSEIVRQINRIIDEHHLNVAPIKDSMVLNFLFPFAPMYRMFSTYNSVVEELEAK